MNVVEEALIFATHAHEGQTRKMSTVPYILHPAEVASIIATLTEDKNTIAAGLLHDTVEDCDVAPETIREKFGSRVYALVMSETEDKLSSRPASETWMQRKEESILMLSMTKDRDVKILWLGDKLSNIRSFYRQYLQVGNHVFDSLHQKDPKIQGWYYKTIRENLKEFAGTAAYEEYSRLVDAIFGAD